MHIIAYNRLFEGYTIRQNYTTVIHIIVYLKVIQLVLNYTKLYVVMYNCISASVHATFCIKKSKTLKM